MISEEYTRNDMEGSGSVSEYILGGVDKTMNTSVSLKKRMEEQ